jgi:hypothetical protein
MRCSLPYQLAIVVSFQTVLGGFGYLRKVGQPLAFEARPPYLMGASWRSRFVEGSIQAQACDEGDRIGELAAAIEELQGSVSAIGYDNYPSLWVPAP